MKYALAALFALVSTAALAVEPFYGCEVEPIPGTNAFQFVDATCAAAVTQNTADYELVEVLPGVFASVPTNNK